MPLTLRLMTRHDLPAVLRLKEQAGWNQTPGDCLRFLDLSPEGCFVAESDGQVVGTTVTIRFGSVTWLAMVLVDAQRRGQGIGAAIVAHAVAYLDRLGVVTQRLDATPMGLPLYEKLGFLIEGELLRFQGIAPPPPEDAAWPRRPNELDAPRSDQIEPATPAHLDALAAFDAAATGEHRRAILARFLSEFPESMHLFTRGGQVLGYAAHRPGVKAQQIGPCLATDPAAALALLDQALAQCAGQRVYIDIPAGNEAANCWARSRGLKPQRTLTRMRRGPAVAWNPLQLFASSGPEKG